MNFDLYASLLKMNDSFRRSDEGVSPAVDFTAPELSVLRDTYDLAGAAGNGDAFCKAVRVMEWLTIHVRHDRSCNPEGPRCALTALAYAYDQPERGVNCAWLATTLTECLLSLKIAARTVYIMPFAPYDGDNHVVTHVWYPEIAKWVMLDPTTNSFVKDQAGQPLDVFEIRALLADQKEIVFSDGFRYNGKPYDATEHRDYLAKDLFWFRMAETSRYQEDNRERLVIAPEGFDPRRRTELNIQYRMRIYGEQPGMLEWLKAVKNEKLIYCSIEDALKAP